MMKSLHLATALLSICTPQVFANCTSFTPSYLPDYTIDYAYTTSQKTYRVSAIVNCSTGQTTPGTSTGLGAERCSRNECVVHVDPGVTLRLNRTVNIDISAEAEQNIFDLVKRYFPARANLNATKVWEAPPAAACINDTLAAYYAFTPFYYCVNGALGNCSGDGYPTSGTNITACGLDTYGNGQYIDGPTGLVWSNGVGNTPAPPNATEPVGNAASRVGSTIMLGATNPVFAFLLVVLLTCGL